MTAPVKLTVLILVDLLLALAFSVLTNLVSGEQLIQQLYRNHGVWFHLGLGVLAALHVIVTYQLLASTSSPATATPAPAPAPPPAPRASGWDQWFYALVGAVFAALVVSPVDACPDIIPIIGWLDDAGYLFGSVLAFLASLVRSIFGGR